MIMTYKLTKGIAQCAGAAVIAGLILSGYGPELVELATQLRRHVAGAGSIKLANLLLALASPHHLWEIVVALILDGSLTIFEGVSLVRGYWWGPWLVVVATSSFLPFEVLALLKYRHAGRLVLLAINVAIVAYLVGRARRERTRE